MLTGCLTTMTDLTLDPPERRKLPCEDHRSNPKKNLSNFGLVVLMPIRQFNLGCILFNQLGRTEKSNHKSSFPQFLPNKRATTFSSGEKSHWELIGTKGYFVKARSKELVRLQRIRSDPKSTMTSPVGSFMYTTTSSRRHDVTITTT